MSRRASLPRAVGATLLAAACALVSCAKASNYKPSVRISTQTQSRAAATMAPYGGLICATFELQPFQLLPDGTPDTSGQTPVIIHSTPASGTTDAILGCIDGPGYMGNNWGYVVTAHDFGDCTTWTNPDGTLGSSGTPDPTHPNGEPIPGLSPLSVQFEQTFECKAGVDNSLDLTANVSVAESDGAGYVDITAGVDSTLVMVGCKTADFGVADGLLHFGETGFYDPTVIPAPYGLTGIGYIDSTLGPLLPPASAVTQFSGIIDDVSSGDKAAYFTGILSQTTVPAGSTLGSWDVVQTFAQPCAAGQFYAATQAPECDTTLDGNGQLSTATLLADVVETIPNALWLSARIAPNGSSILLLSGTATQLSDPNAPPTEAWNPEVQNSVVSFGSSAAVAGLYVDLASPGTLSVVVSESGTLSYYKVSQPAPGQPFQASAPSLLSSLTGAQLNTLFTPIVSGCQGGSP